VREDDAAFLRYLTELGIGLQAHVEVTERAPFDGPIQITVAGRSHAVGRAVAERIFVEMERQQPTASPSTLG
jgi:Fe2+ transport system protein FeoA